MEDISNNILITNVPSFKDHTHLAVMLEFDGHILISLFQDADLDLYMYMWRDADENYDRYLVVRIAPATLYNYLQAQVSLRNILLQPKDGILYIFDIHKKDRAFVPCVIMPAVLPESYISYEDSYFELDEMDPEKYEEMLEMSIRRQP